MPHFILNYVNPKNSIAYNNNKNCYTSMEELIKHFKY